MPLRVLWAAAREVRDVFRAATPMHRCLRDHLVAVTVATLGVDLLGTNAAFLLERHSQQTEIKTFGSAAFWTTTQLLRSPRRSRIRSRQADESSTSSWRSGRSPSSRRSPARSAASCKTAPKNWTASTDRSAAWLTLTAGTHHDCRRRLGRWATGRFADGPSRWRSEARLYRDPSANRSAGPLSSAGGGRRGAARL